MVILSRYLKQRRGFTLLELLIVIVIISILAAIIFVALDPLTRFRDTRDARRAAEARSILQAIKLDQVDNRGPYLSSISAKTADEVYMIVNGSSMVAGCDDNNLYCDTAVDSDTHCVDLSGLVTEGYLSTMPVSPSSGSVTWDDGSSAGDEGTGYTMSRNTNGSITIRACESENTTEIVVQR